MQLSYNEKPAEAFAGKVSDLGFKDIISRICAAKQLYSVVVTTEYNSEDFIVTIDGTDYTYTADTDATKAEIAAGLIALIEAGDDDVTCTLFTTSEADDSFYLENNSFETEITVTITNPVNGVLTLTELVDHEDSIPFGAVVVNDDRQTANADTGKLEQCRLPRLSADITSRHVLGVVIADTSKLTRSTEPYGGYGAGEAVPILKKGRIWMSVEDVATVDNGGLVYVRSTASGTEELGAIRAADDAGDTDPIDSNAAHFTGRKITSLNLAEVEWNLP